MVLTNITKWKIFSKRQFSTRESPTLPRTGNNCVASTPHCQRENILSDSWLPLDVLQFENASSTRTKSVTHRACVCLTDCLCVWQPVSTNTYLDIDKNHIDRHVTIYHKDHTIVTARATIIDKTSMYWCTNSTFQPSCHPSITFEFEYHEKVPDKLY